MFSALDNLMKPPVGQSFSASGENVYGKKGAGGMDDPLSPANSDVTDIGQIPDMEPNHPARELGVGKKVRPWIYLDPGVETPLLDVDGPGIVRHFWITTYRERFRKIILKMYWDNEPEPSVIAPLGDFFCCAPEFYGEMQSLAFCVNAANALNCYLPMPFRKHARITLTSLLPEPMASLYYTINFTKEPVAEDALYLHASFRTAYPLTANEDFTIADNISGKGRFAGCYLTWRQNSPGWWGEGEIKMFIDDDRDFPTICGTGTEDYICGAWNFGDHRFSSPYSGYIAETEELPGKRHAMYRFHLADPILFSKNLKIKIQALGWQENHRFLPLADDLTATAYWYQSEPHAALPQLPKQIELPEKETAEK